MEMRGLVSAPPFRCGWCGARMPRLHTAVVGMGVLARVRVVDSWASGRVAVHPATSRAYM
eukprot:1661578-Prymnesium_polylepis.1